MSANQNAHQKLAERTAEFRQLEGVIIDVKHLVSALQIVCWDLCQYSTHEPRLKELRSAIIGLGDALELVTKDALK